MILKDSRPGHFIVDAPTLDLAIHAAMDQSDEVRRTIGQTTAEIEKAHYLQFEFVTVQVRFDEWRDHDTEKLWVFKVTE